MKILEKLPPILQKAKSFSKCQLAPPQPRIILSELRLYESIRHFPEKCQLAHPDRELDAGGKPSTWLPPGETRRALFVCERREATKNTKSNEKQKLNVKVTSKTLQQINCHQNPENMKTTKQKAKENKRTAI